MYMILLGCIPTDSMYYRLYHVSILVLNVLFCIRHVICYIWQWSADPKGHVLVDVALYN